jgi:hypothetical protein
VRLLVDSYLAVWAALDPDALTEADAPLVLSAVSVSELRLKWHDFHITDARTGPLDPSRF